MSLNIDLKRAMQQALNDISGKIDFTRHTDDKVDLLTLAAAMRGTAQVLEDLARYNDFAEGTYDNQ